MQIRSSLLSAALAAALLALPSVTFAGSLIGSRAALNTLLGASATTENFEAYPIGNGNAVADPSVLTLNSSTVFQGSGPGLINSALSIDTPGGLQWNGPNYFGQPSRDILANGNNLVINFLSGTKAFGIDLLAYSGYSDVASAVVKDLSGNTLGTFTNLTLDGSTTPVVPTFFGYTDAGGIGSVTFAQSGHAWSPIIDNLTFGTPAAGVPEPSTIASAALAVFAGLGAAGSRRRRASR